MSDKVYRYAIYARVLNNGVLSKKEYKYYLSEDRIAEKSLKGMEANYQALLKDYDELYEQNEKLKAELELIDKNSKNVDAYINDWEKVGL